MKIFDNRHKVSLVSNASNLLCCPQPSSLTQHSYTYVLQCKPSTNINSDTSYSINNRELSKVTEHRDLGIIFIENLSWHSHHKPS